jgi:hypothetical protein
MTSVHRFWVVMLCSDMVVSIVLEDDAASLFRVKSHKCSKSL